MVTTISHLTGALAGLREETEELVNRLRESVVIVRDEGRGAGSGVIWSENGLIVTNAHVVQGRNVRVELRDGRAMPARVTNTDPVLDLAILRVDAAGLPAASAGDSDLVRVGELVFAVGNPLGLRGAVNTGIVTAAPRSRRGASMVCADVSLAPGNSGGMLARADGSVIGINSMMRMPGMALAVPSNAVRDLLAQANGERGFLGLTLQQVALPEAWTTDTTGDTGFLVSGVVPEGPAQAAGVMIGDIIVGSDGDALAAPESLTWRLQRLRADELLHVTILRGGRELTLQLLAGRQLQKAA
jgi:serine protease Do